ncbi:MAG: hypothetical protein K2Y18_10135 [Alphaproteobacteria bacterium]|jgi:hypothetical protein|nr:hypothetical protein [Alphaproteobacteria bacterium]
MVKYSIRLISFMALLSCLSGTIEQTMGSDDELILDEGFAESYSHQLYLALQDHKIEAEHSDCTHNCEKMFHSKQEPLLARIQKEYPNIHIMPANKRDSYSRMMATISAEKAKCLADCGHAAISRNKQKRKP